MRKPEHAAPCSKSLGELRARSGVYAIFGGHDYQQNPRNIAANLNDARIEVLKNGALPIIDGVWLIAIDDVAFGSPDIKKAFSKVPDGAVRIVLTHNPKIFPSLRNMNCLVLTAHTHAGQVDIPGIPRNQIPGLLSYEYIRGWYHDGDSRLYVNRGIGTVTPYVRFRARPEISLFLINRGNPDVAGMRKNDPINRNSLVRKLAKRLMSALKNKPNVREPSDIVD